jgi:hypothetical protein
MQVTPSVHGQATAQPQAATVTHQVSSISLLGCCRQYGEACAACRVQLPGVQVSTNSYLHVQQQLRACLGPCKQLPGPVIHTLRLNLV